MGLAALRFIKSHPAWMAGGGLLLAAWRPGFIWKWLQRGWVTWQIVHKLHGS